MLSIFLDTSAPPCPAPFNMAAYVLGTGAPDQLALRVISAEGSSDWTYGAMRDQVARLASALVDQGLTPGDRVLMRIRNSAEFPLVYLAALWAGLVPVPASAGLTVPEITAIAAELRPAMVIRSGAVSIPDGPDCPILDYTALVGETAMAPLMGDPNRPAYIIYTSGTSGKPRGVIHAHRAVWARRMMWDGWYGLTPHDRVLHAGAFNWTYTLGTGLMDPWACGATALIPVEGTKASALPTLMVRYGATIFAAAPGVYRQMLREGPVTVPTLRHGLSAGEKLPDRIRAAFRASTGCAVHEALGMSECSTFISGSPAKPAAEGSSGRPQPGRHVAVLDSEGTPVARHTPGTLAIHRDDPGLMLGYLGAEDETAARYIGDWFVTGDTVEMAQDDSITYLGRDDDMMNAGGFRVSPLEVEAALARHPGIAEAAVVEHRVKADVTVIAAYYTGPVALLDDDLTAFTAANLARYKCPRIFTHIDALPKSGNGKINRKALRQ
ncbi:class I adenylate-forming enzyme family protein [Actibacterium sp. 188UL27-1]|uniref:class I adenylate-forming enzyme family protein n=1 Tax=Actibacterium sp. 188UL27-1 TaxID=2786961 RepID=UPI00195BF136|nr:class I adenylate-forming enzyme family protein [Actibacterium sp. 188UL27-1]MBM7069686.1 acyl--CoA ligase [Actibacterium sp. 188UL27-1]